MRPLWCSMLGPDPIYHGQESQLDWETCLPRSRKRATFSHRHFRAEGLHSAPEEKGEGEPAPNLP